MSAVDQEALTEIMREQAKMLKQYDPNPKFIFNSCYCIIFYKRVPNISLAGERSDDQIEAVYACPLHESNTMKACCSKARDESRKIQYKFGSLDRPFTDEEKKIMDDEQEANRDTCLRLKSRQILEKLR